MKRLKETENFFSLMNKCDSLFLFYLFNFVLDLRFDFRFLFTNFSSLHLLQLRLNLVHRFGLIFVLQNLKKGECLNKIFIMGLLTLRIPTLNNKKLVQLWLWLGW